MPPDTLASYPYVTVRIACSRCGRRGQYRLVRLAAKYGPDIAMADLLAFLAGDCIDWRPRHPYRPGCGAYFVDLERPPPRDEPPSPAVRLRVVKGA